MIKVEVVFASEKYVEMIPLNLESGSSVHDAIEKSGILTKHPEINLGETKVGIYSKICELNTHVEDGDRIEIYRPLKADPKDARRMRAEQQKKV